MTVDATLNSPYVSRRNKRQFKGRIWQCDRRYLLALFTRPPFYLKFFYLKIKLHFKGVNCDLPCRQGCGWI